MMKVIDISAWQENIDWKAVKDIGIGGVIIKIGEKTHLDDMFITHVNNAVTYNLPYGIYYYAHASTIDEAIAEANWVDKQIKTYLNGKNPELGIWYDAEDESMFKNNINVAYMIGNFINRLNELNYNYVGLYSSYNWLTNIIDLNLLADYIPIWTAQYGYHENRFEKYSKVDFDTKIRDWARYYYYDPSDAINANFIPEDVTVKDVIVTLLNKEDIYEKIHFDDDCLVEILLECIRELLTNSTNAVQKLIDEIEKEEKEITEEVRRQIEEEKRLKNNKQMTSK